MTHDDTIKEFREKKVPLPNDKANLLRPHFEQLQKLLASALSGKNTLWRHPEGTVYLLREDMLEAKLREAEERGLEEGYKKGSSDERILCIKKHGV